MYDVIKCADRSIIDSEEMTFKESLSMLMCAFLYA